MVNDFHLIRSKFIVVTYQVSLHYPVVPDRELQKYPSKCLNKNNTWRVNHAQNIGHQQS